jgi:hypothetical protein
MVNTANQEDDVSPVAENQKGMDQSAEITPASESNSIGNADVPVTKKEPSSASGPPADEAATTAKPRDAKTAVGEMLMKEDLDDGSSSALQELFRENDGLKEKCAKLKALLGRSAKAQRETKVEMESSHKKLDAAHKEIQRLKAKIEKLATRPSHMDLINDFETKFDRAILAVGGGMHHQTGGQDTGGSASSFRLSSPNDVSSSTSYLDEPKGIDSLFMSELTESKERITKLEKLNETLERQVRKLEADLAECKGILEGTVQKLQSAELERRISVMEADAARSLATEKTAQLQEMQLEIDLVTKSAQKTAMRFQAADEKIKTAASDKQLIQHLQDKNKALTEWATAANQVKTLAQERVRLLEAKLNHGKPSDSGGDDQDQERVLCTQKGSFVVGAGDSQSRTVMLDNDMAKTVRFSERVVLRWTFDLMTEDADIMFRIVKGKNDAIVTDRLVTGGAAGETENAFDVGRDCTLTWSNRKSWIRPRTVKFNISVIVLND